VAVETRKNCSLSNEGRETLNSALLNIRDDRRNRSMLKMVVLERNVQGGKRGDGKSIGWEN